MAGLRVQSCKQQQMLIGQRPQHPLVIRPPQNHLHGIAALLHLDLGGITPAHPTHLAPGNHDFSHRPTNGQQAIHVPAQKAVHTNLSPAAGHVANKFLHSPLGLGICTVHLKATAKAHQLSNCRIQHRNGLPDLAIDPLLPIAQRHKPPQIRKRMRRAAAQLTRRRNPAPLLLLPHFHSPFMVDKINCCLYDK